MEILNLLCSCLFAREVGLKGFLTQNIMLPDTSAELRIQIGLHSCFASSSVSHFGVYNHLSPGAAPKLPAGWAPTSRGGARPVYLCLSENLMILSKL